jgi:hypothetical protein
MRDQSILVLGLLQGFLLRAAAERHKDRVLIVDLMRGIRQKQAQQEFEEICLRFETILPQDLSRTPCVEQRIYMTREEAKRIWPDAKIPKGSGGE